MKGAGKGLAILTIKQPRKITIQCEPRPDNVTADDILSANRAALISVFGYPALDSITPRRPAEWPVHDSRCARLR